MAEFNFDELMQRLRGDPKPTDPGVGFTGQGTRELGVSDIIFPQAAPAEGEVEQELVGGPDVGFTGQDPSAQFLDPEELQFLLQQQPMGERVSPGGSALEAEAIMRGLDPKGQATQQLTQQALRQAAPFLPGFKNATELAVTMAISGTAPFALSAAGARLLAWRGVGKLTGATAGSIIGSEVNQKLGLEADTGFNDFVAATTPIAGAGISRFGRTLLAGTGAGRAARAGESRRLLTEARLRQSLPNVEQAFGRALPQQLRNDIGIAKIARDATAAVRAPGRTIDIGDTIDQWAKFNPREQGEIINAIRNANPELATKVEQFFAQRRLPVLRRAAGARAPAVITGSELVDMRQGLNNTARDLLEPSAEKLRTAADRERISLNRAKDIFDKTTVQQALGAEHLTSVRFNAIKFANDELADHIRKIGNPKQVGSFTGREFNMARLITDMDEAVAILKKGKAATREELRHPLLESAKLLQDEGSLKAWTRDMRQLSKLAVGNNIQIFGETFGIVTRAAAFAGEVGGARAMGEMMSSPVGRFLLINFARINGGKFNPATLSTGLAMMRAITTGQLEGADEAVLDLYGRSKDALLPQVPTGLTGGPSDPGLLEATGVNPPPTAQPR